MCGICGFINNSDNTKNLKIIDEMISAIRHRGPDARNSFSDEFVTLGFCRLSFIDLKSGMQPLFNEEKSLVLAFNGEIYNYKDLQKTLIEYGHNFQTESDGEVILHGFEQFGTEIFEKLNGMFSIALYDCFNNKVFLVRDSFGIKPLYFYSNGKNFFFASEIKAFFSHPNFKKEFNYDALSDYLSFGFTPLGKTLFSNVYKLEQGSYLEYDLATKTYEISRYFQFEFLEDLSRSSVVNTEDVLNVMNSSIKNHLMREESIAMGCFLSGGIDSNYIVFNVPDSEKKNLKVFSVGYKEEGYSELPISRANATLAFANFNPRVIDSTEYLNNFEKVVYHLDEPLADPSVSAIFSLTNEAAKQAKMTLSGEGADELFSGYNSYRRIYFLDKYRRLPNFMRKLCESIIRPFLPSNLKTFIDEAKTPLKDRFIGCGTLLMDRHGQEELLKNKNLYTDPRQIVHDLLKETNYTNDLHRAQYIDINLWLPNSILLKADKMSMAHSLEVRTPFLDKFVYQVARKIPASQNITLKTTKMILRRAALKNVPLTTSKRKKKGFPVPLREWINDEHFFAKIKERFTSKSAKNFFNINYLETILHEQKSGTHNHLRKIWAIYSFLTWYKVFFEDRSPLQDEKKTLELAAK